MKSLTIAAALALLALPVASITVASTPAIAASAHNSQAGSAGDSSNNAAPLHRHRHRYRK
jgi:hypothetical protein